MVKLFDLGEADVDLGAVLQCPLVQQVGQTVQGLRAKHHIDIRRAGNDGAAFLAGNTAAHTDKHALGFQVLDAPQIGEHLFLRLFPYRAGVEQDQVSLIYVQCRFIALCGTEHVNHLVRVVLVHLAAKGLDKYFFAHGSLSKGAMSNRYFAAICGGLRRWA